MTTHETRSTPPREAAMAGKAVATMVWSTTARNMGSMTEGKTLKNSLPVGGGLFSRSSFMASHPGRTLARATVAGLRRLPTVEELLGAPVASVNDASAPTRGREHTRRAG